MDPQLNEMFKWSIQNSDASLKDPSAKTQPPPQLSAAAVQRLFSERAVPMVSDLDLMDQSMIIVENQENKLDDRLSAFEDLEMLIQNLDNANNLESRDLWSRLIEQLQSTEKDIRYFAAWCCGTAVQNNIRSQERALVMDVIPKLVRMSTEDTAKDVRNKAIFALSSSVRNFQPGLDAALPHLPTEYKPQHKLDANDMNSVDTLVNKLRENV